MQRCGALRFRRRAVSANVPSFWFLVQGNVRMYTRPVFGYRGTSECTLVPVLALRAKGTLISEPIFYPLRDAIFPTRERENGLCRGFFFEKAVFPFSRGKNRISQGVENRGSLISVPLALRVVQENIRQNRSLETTLLRTPDR